MSFSIYNVSGKGLLSLKVLTILDPFSAVQIMYGNPESRIQDRPGRLQLRSLRVHFSCAMLPGSFLWPE